MGARVRCASATICTICASSVSAPTRSARIVKLPVPLIVPPVTFSPGCFSTAIPSLHLIERHPLIAAIPADPDRGLGSKLEQGANGAARVFARTQLEHFAEQDQHRDHRRRLEVETDFSVGIAKRRGK